RWLGPGQRALRATEEARGRDRLPVGRQGKDLQPPSIPTSRPVGRSGVGSHAQAHVTTHWPVVVRRRVAVLGVPSSRRCRRSLPRPTFEITSRCSARSGAQPPGPWGKRRLSERPRPRRGGSRASPRPLPAGRTRRTLAAGAWPPPEPPGSAPPAIKDARALSDRATPLV